MGKKYVDFCGIVSPRAANPATCAIVGARTRNAESASPRVDRGHRLVGVRRVGDALRLKALDRLRVERVVMRVDAEELPPR